MLGKLNCHVKRLGVFLITAALIAGVAGCNYTPPSQDLEIRTWYDLDDVRNNLEGNHKLMNDLDSTTAGYQELASPTANEGKGWQPIGYGYWAGPQVFGEIFRGTLDGQGYEIRDLYVNDPDGCQAGLLGFVGEGAIIEDLSVVNVTVTGCEIVDGLVRLSQVNVRPLIGYMWVSGGLVAYNRGAVSNCHAMGNVTGYSSVGGLVGYNEGTVKDSYFSGNVAGYEYVGGLVGINSGTMSNCYSSAGVNGNSFTGGLVGHKTEGTVSDSFWDIETSGQTTSDGGTGKTTAEMKDVATFSGAGWNIITMDGPDDRNPSYIWNIVDAVTYPFLSWEV
jgi:hypothetical protein